MKRGLAEQLGARDRLGRGFSLDRRDIGIDVTGYIEKDNPKNENVERVPLPKGHRFFHDCERESFARTIERVIKREDVESWFVTLTFKEYVSEEKAKRQLTSWLYSVAQALRQTEGAGGLNWIVAQEWQKRNVIHFHVILYGVRLHSLLRKRQETRWLGISGGFACVYDASPKAAPYLAKYASKARGGEIWWGSTSQGSALRSAKCCKAQLPG